MLLSLNDLPEPVDLATVKRCYEKKLQSERLLFLSICPESDRILLKNNNLSMSLQDFDRILFLLEALELSNYSNHLQMQHADLLDQLATGIEQDVANPQHGPDRYLRKYESKIILFGGAERMLQRKGINPAHMNLAVLKSHYSEFQEKKQALSSRCKTSQTEIKELELMRQNMNQYLDMSPALGRVTNPIRSPEH